MVVSISLIGKKNLVHLYFNLLLYLFNNLSFNLLYVLANEIKISINLYKCVQLFDNKHKCTVIICIKFSLLRNLLLMIVVSFI